jgi:serine/threonine protein kinase
MRYAEAGVSWVPMSDRIPERIGPYRIVRKLGEGGMGAVFEAINETIERRVAIKVLHPEFARMPEFTGRFFNEARAVNRVDHPGLVQISDYGQLPDGMAYIVMEFLKGESLSHRLRQSGGALSLAEVLNIGWQLADSLTTAHKKHIIHRDLKPDNVMLVPDPHMATGERTKLLDFGIAKVTETGGTGPQVKTRTNALMGTPLYMSPEQCAGAGGVDTESDVYSLGVMLYEMLTGRRPFVAEGSGQLMGMHMFQEPEPLRSVAPAVPAQMAEFVHRMLRKQKEQRPPMQQVADTLEAFFALAPAPAKRKIPVADGSQERRTQPYDMPSTLGHSASQIDGGRRRHFWLVAAMALVVLGGTGYAVLRDKKQMSSSTAPSGSSPQAHESKGSGRSIVWRLETEPSGADVVNAANGEWLGQTP